MANHRSSGHRPSSPLLTPRSVKEGKGQLKNKPIRPNYHKPKGSVEVLKLEEHVLAAFDAGDLDYYLADQERLDFPCNDSSRNVQDFSEWSYFKAFKESRVKMVAKGHSSMWCEDMLTKVNNHASYQMIKEGPKLTIAKQTKMQRERMKRAKAQLAKWKKQLEEEAGVARSSISGAYASDGGSVASSRVRMGGRANAPRPRAPARVVVVKKPTARKPTASPSRSPSPPKAAHSRNRSVSPGRGGHC